VDVSDKLARRFLDAAPDPTVIVDSKGIIIYANARVGDVLGYEAAELIDRPVEYLLPERYRAGHPGHRSDFFAKSNPRPMGADLELFVLHKDGREIPVEISLSPVETETGVLVSSAIRDISEQKEIQRQLLEANRAKSQFLAAASHDLRQPIQTLSLLNRAARNSVTDKTHLTIIEKQQISLDSMSRLLNSLLDISKLEAGVVRPDISDCAVQDIFESLRAEFDEQAQHKGLQLIIDRCDGVARSDPRLLTQILENLISNAIKYTREGSVRLRCRHRDPGIRIEVLDTGLGIPSDELGRIFEEFHQVDQGSRRPEGLGLGLSIVKRTAELLDCSLDVKSTPGKGSVFSVVVPEIEASRFHDETPQSEQLIAPARGQVLVVDDEPEVTFATRMLLEIEGFDVLTAASREEAIKCVGDLERAPDLLIIDYHLRNETGLDVIHAVRDHMHTAIPAILISGDTSDRVVVAERDDTAFLTKPVDADELLAEIQRQISNT
jgi:PAS domain S-box-containing protein